MPAHRPHQPQGALRQPWTARKVLLTAVATLSLGCGITDQREDETALRNGAPVEVSDSQTQFVIPQIPDDQFIIYGVGETLLVDGKEFPRNLEASFAPILIERDDESCPFIYGYFALEQATVLESSGGELAVVQTTPEGLQIEHDGPATHLLEFKGRLTAVGADTCPGVLEEDGAIPFTFTHSLIIEPFGSIKLRFAEPCPGEQLVIPGGSIYGLSFDIFDENGEKTYPANVSSKGPVDIEILATKGTAITFDPEEGLGSLLVEGQSQVIEIAAQGRRLGRLRLIELAQIDDWTVSFGMSGGTKLNYEYLDIQTGDILGVPFLGALFSAHVELFSKGERICNSSLPASAFKSASSTPEVCSMYSLGEDNEQLSPIGWFTSFGECAFSFEMPAANQGKGFSTDRKVTTVEKPL